MDKVKFVFIKNYPYTCIKTERMKTSEEKREYNRKYYQANKERILAKEKERYDSNKDKISERRKRYRQENKEKVNADDRKHYQRRRDKILIEKKEYQNTQIGRAYNLVSSYAQSDRNLGRGECTLTGQWVVDNIFTKPCHYCGETDWYKLGCDRVDNDLPHTPDNVVPCCCECNKDRGNMDFNEYIKLKKNGRKN